MENDDNAADNPVRDIKDRLIKKGVLEQVDDGSREEAEEFLKKYRNDTLTGL